MKAIVVALLMWLGAAWPAPGPGHAAYGGGGGVANACGNGLDDDGDGVADYPGDMGCTSPYDTTESGDNMVIVGNTISSAQLNACINGADQGTGGNLCNNVAGAKLATTTVVGCSSSANLTNVCASPTARTVSDAFVYTYANTAYNQINFANGWSDVGGCFTGINVANTRLVNTSSLATPPGGACDGTIGVSAGATGLVIDHSTLDGRFVTATTCRDIQIGFSAANARLTNNLIKNFCPDTDDPQGRHAEGLYITAPANNLLIMGNDFEDDYGTAAIFPNDSNNGVFPADMCTTSNLFGPNHDSSFDYSNRNDGGSSLYVMNNAVNPATRTTPQKCNDPDGTLPYVGPVAVCIRGSNGICRQCHDGIDNDGDGKIDYWPDGLGDPECSGFTDDDESN